MGERIRYLVQTTRDRKEAYYAEREGDDIMVYGGRNSDSSMSLGGIEGSEITSRDQDVINVAFLHLLRTNSNQDDSCPSGPS